MGTVPAYGLAASRHAGWPATQAAVAGPSSGAAPGANNLPADVRKDIKKIAAHLLHLCKVGALEHEERKRIIDTLYDRADRNLGLDSGSGRADVSYNGPSNVSSGSSGTFSRRDKKSSMTQLDEAKIAAEFKERAAASGLRIGSPDQDSAGWDSHNDNKSSGWLPDIENRKIDDSGRSSPDNEDTALLNDGASDDEEFATETKPKEIGKGKGKAMDIPALIRVASPSFSADSWDLSPANSDPVMADSHTNNIFAVKDVPHQLTDAEWFAKLVEFDANGYRK